MGHERVEAARRRHRAVQLGQGAPHLRLESLRPVDADAYLAEALGETRSGALEYVVSGAGQPTIVLLNGAGVTLEGWRTLYPAIEHLGTVFAWNRFGVKGSDEPRLALPTFDDVFDAGLLLGDVEVVARVEVRAAVDDVVGRRAAVARGLRPLGGHPGRDRSYRTGRRRTRSPCCGRMLSPTASQSRR